MYCLTELNYSAVYVLLTVLYYSAVYWYVLPNTNVLQCIVCTL